MKKITTLVLILTITINSSINVFANPIFESLIDESIKYPLPSETLNQIITENDISLEEFIIHAQSNEVMRERAVGGVVQGAYTLYLVYQFLRSSGIIATNGSSAVLAEQFYSHYKQNLDNGDDVFLRMTNRIYSLTGEYSTGLNLNLNDFISQFEFESIFSSIRNFFNPSNPNFYYFNGEVIAIGELPFEETVLNRSQVSHSSYYSANSEQALLLNSRSLGKMFIPPEYFDFPDGYASIWESSNELGKQIQVRINNDVFVTRSSAHFEAQRTGFEVLDAFFFISYDDVNQTVNPGRSRYSLCYVLVGVANQTNGWAGFAQGEMFYHTSFISSYSSSGDIRFPLYLIEEVVDGYLPSYSFTYSDELLNPAWDWGDVNERPFVLNPPEAKENGVDDVIVRNPAFPWLNVSNPDITNPPTAPSFSWQALFDYLNGLWNNFTNFFTKPATARLDFSPLYISLSDKFPFSLPFDFYNVLLSFRGEAQIPYLEAVIDTGKYGSAKIEFDFSPFTTVAQIIRYFILVAFSVGLIKKTYGFLGRGS